MAYFNNGTEEMVFDEQCSKCRYGQKPCPIAFAQTTYNYDAVNNETATKILNTLVKEPGVCTMLETFKHDLEIDPNQIDLFD